MVLTTHIIAPNAATELLGHRADDWRKNYAASLAPPWRAA
jgi:hypothetical protein